MIKSWVVMMVVLVASAAGSIAFGQTSSIGAQKRQSDADQSPQVQSREATKPKLNPIYERYSWISVTPTPPKTFKVNDLLTIIIRQRSKYEADSNLRTKKEWDLKSELDAFFKPTEGGLGSAEFRRGKPNVAYEFENELKGRGDLRREDNLTTRITATVIDVKPNGNLVLEGRGQVAFDDEESRITIIGTCRKEDVTADNTVLSTQIGDLNISVENEGAVRGATSRGWIPKLLDLLRPI